MAKDAAEKGQAKLDEAQAKKAADGMLRDLGAAFYATKTGRATPSTDADIENLVAALQAHESEHGQIDLGARVGCGRTDGYRRPAPAGRARRHRRPPGADPPRHRHPPDRPDAVARSAGRCGGGAAATLVGVARDGRVACLLRRGVEQSGSSSGS